MGKQESVSEYFEEAKEIAKIERSLKVEQWVVKEIRAEIRGNPQETKVLKRYDLPRGMEERWQWVMRWRCAWFQCKYPHDNVITASYYYRKVQGHKFGVQEELQRFIAAKAQLSKWEKVVEKYREEHRQANDIFYNEAEDSDLQKALQKLEAKRKNIADAEERLRIKVEQYKATKL